MLERKAHDWGVARINNSRPPRLESIYFGAGEYIALGKVLERSAQIHLGDRWEINVRQIDGHNLKAALASKYVRKELFSNNAHKALEWCRIVKESEIGDRLLLMDADTFIRSSLDEIWDKEFDVAITTRDYRWKSNSGVLFVRVNERTKKFFELITEETFKMLGDAEYHNIYEEKYGGIHQASIGSILEKNEVSGLNVLEIPCKIWNSEHTCRTVEDFVQAKILHLLPSGRSQLRAKRATTKSDVWNLIIGEWKAYREQTVIRKRWDEIIDRLKEMKRGHLVVVEIGVWRGELTEKLLESGLISHLHLIDPWEACDKNKHPSWFNSGSKMVRIRQSKFDEAYRRVVGLVNKYKNATIHRMPSLEAVELIEDNSVDLVFVDGDHSYQGASADIEAWKPKVNSGGYICGHDIDEPRFPGVRQAVELHFDRDRIELGEDFTWFVKLKGYILNEAPTTNNSLFSNFKVGSK